MSWSKPEETSWGGFKSVKNEDELYSKDLKNGSIDRNNHVHFHKDGITITKNGEKNTIYKTNS
jgi:hypothetical protein